MPQLVCSVDFFTAFSRIPRDQQKKTWDFITRFQRDPQSHGTHLESLHDVRDRRVRTARIDQTYRAVLLALPGNTYMLIWVDHHDEAMEWARNKILERNPLTGALQLIDLPVVEPPEASGGMPGLFDSLSDEDLLSTGLPQLLLPAVRGLKTREDLDSLKHYLPEEAYEALFWFCEGNPLSEAIAVAAIKPAATGVDTTDIIAALDHPDSRRRFVVINTADELVKMLNAPLEKWRVFLHPSQADLVKRHFSGPARVLGGAGTGKTVVAMHRVRHLAAEVFAAKTDRILFTTFTRNLAANIRENLRNLCGSEYERIEVVHLHSWAASLLRNQGVRFEIASAEEFDACWRDAIREAALGEWDEPFYRQEWDRVVQAQGIHDRDEYLRAPRVGLYTRLTRLQRAAIWDVFDEYNRNLAKLGKIEWVELIRQTRLYLAQQGLALPYRAIIVDETQDMHPEELRLLRQIVPEGPNDLFLVGDAHQRIYGRPAVLSNCGINIRGRSSKLRINYRTTEEIRDWSVAVLTGQAIDDLDGGLDSSADYRSLLHGGQPTVKHFDSLADECSYLVQAIRELGHDVALQTICLVARRNYQLDQDYAPALARAGIPYLRLQADTPENAGDGIRLATMHRVKGLEFHHVFVAGVNDGIVPLESSSKGSNKEGDVADSELQERCLLHVAASRARDTLTITSYGLPSKLIVHP